MKINHKMIILGLSACLTILALIGCEQQGPAEKAGEKIDNAVRDAGEAMEEAGEKIKENMDE